MQPLLQNKYVRFGLLVIGAVIALSVILIIFAMLNTSRSSTGFELSGVDIEGDYYAPSAPIITNSISRDSFVGESVSMEAVESSYYPYPPVPTPDSYTTELETYETTSYNVTARTKEFDELCNGVETLKTDSQIHFRNLTSSTNNCRATFFVATEKVQNVLDALTAFRGVEISRNTESVTKHKQQLESQTTILEQQLARTEASLAAAEAQLTRLNELFNTSNEVTKLSSEVTNSLRYIDQLTQKKIGYLSQLNNLYQQAADLKERMDVVQFEVSIYRAHPLYPNQDAQKWGSAWEELKNHFTDTLIGISAFFGIFLLWTIRIVLYLLVLIVILRGIWKFGKFVWSRW